MEELSFGMIFNVTWMKCWWRSKIGVRTFSNKIHVPKSKCMRLICTNGRNSEWGCDLQKYIIVVTNIICITVWKHSEAIISVFTNQLGIFVSYQLSRNVSCNWVISMFIKFGKHFCHGFQSCLLFIANVSRLQFGKGFVVYKLNAKCLWRTILT